MIAVICILGRVDLLFHHTACPLAAAVAYVRRSFQVPALLRLISPANITARVSLAYSADFVTVQIPADVFNLARGMLVLIGFTWDIAKAIVFFYLRMLPNLFRDRCRIFMDNSGDGGKGVAIVQSLFDVDAV